MTLLSARGLSKHFDGLVAVDDVDFDLPQGEVRALIAGELDSEACIEAIQTASRRYAKRQRTWFRRETGFQSVCVAAEEDPLSAARRILAAFAEFSP